MKHALDPELMGHLTLPDTIRMAADLGYEFIELGPRPDFIPFYVHPRAGADAIEGVKVALRETGVKVADVVTGDYRFSMPDETLRLASVRYWKRLLQIAAELDTDTVHSEFGGTPGMPEECEAAFWRSMDELLPEHERLGLALNLQPHPYNFIETNDAAVDMVRGMDHPLVGYVYVAAHTFHLGEGSADMVRYARDVLKQVLIADSMDHRATGGRRFIVNPHRAPVTVHQHLGMGEGEVDFDELFSALGEIGFDGILTNNVFSQGEGVLETYARDKEATLNYLQKYGLRSRDSGPVELSKGSKEMRV
jgi:myo-inositol catabolism protein IolH